MFKNLLFTSSSAFAADVPDNGHCIRCVVLSCFNLHFSDVLWCETSFYMLICICILPLVGYCKVFCPFFLTQLISYCSVLRVFCIFLYNPLSNIFCKYFIQAYGLFFHSVAIIFHRAEVLNFVFLCYKKTFTNSPLKTALTEFHRVYYVIFSFSFS